MLGVAFSGRPSGLYSVSGTDRDFIVIEFQKFGVLGVLGSWFL